MANTYTQMYVQIVFAVQGKSSLISEEHREEIEKLICAIIKGAKSKPLAIYCNPDHVHILIGLNPTSAVSDLVGHIKASSSKFVNEHNWQRGKFHWQEGYGAFTYSKSHVDAVIKYILNQSSHHEKKSFREEYLLMLDQFRIEYNDRYLFEWYE
jgi:REP element-mobilizing transposase RayT